MDQLKKAFADTPNVLIGNADCAGSAQQFCGQNGVQGYPSLKVFKDGKSSDFNGARNFQAMKQHIDKNLDPRPACSLESKDACSAKDRAILDESEKMTKAERLAKIKGVEASVKEKRAEAVKLEREAKELAASLDLIKAGGQTVEKVEQLLDEAEMRAHCESRTCIIAFLPHIYDDQSKARNERLKALDDALKATKKDGKSVGFLWTQGGDQFEMEEALGLQFGFPAVIAVNFGKNRFGIHRGTLEKDAVTQFLLSLGRGGVPLAPIPANLKVVKADKWDGKDAKPLEEDL